MAAFGQHSPGLKIFHVRILFLVSLLFVEVINPYSVFKFLIFIDYKLIMDYKSNVSVQAQNLHVKNAPGCNL